MRKIWPKGTVLYTQDDTAYTIRSANDSGGSAIIYFASSSRSGVRAVLKEFYPSEGWVRRNGVPVREKCAEAVWDDSVLQISFQELADLAKQELDVSQEISARTMLVWPFREMLRITKICEPGSGPVWLPENGVGDTLPCSILLMDDLNHPDGLWLNDLLREAAFENSAEHPLGNLQGQEEPELAVPPVAVAVDAAECILSLLYRIHRGGYLHGDINLGNVFLLTDHTGGKITGAMTIDFGSVRRLIDGRTEIIQKDTLFTTPGFRAPEIENMMLTDAPLQLTEKADVYSVGKLLRFLLCPEAAAAFREHRSLLPWLNGDELLRWDVYDNRISPEILRRLNEILDGAAKTDPNARSSVEKMLEQLAQVQRLLERPVWQVQLALPTLNADEVVGRDKDVCAITKKLEENKKLVLYGFSGIGKTKLSTFLGHEWQRYYPGTQVYYAFFPGSMTSLVLDTLAGSISTVETTEEKDGKKEARPGKEIAADVFQELNAKMYPDDMLIIDNMDDDTKSWNELVHEKSPWGQDLFEALCRLQCKVVFVTRMDLRETKGTVSYEVGKLDVTLLRGILRRYSEDAQKRPDEELDALIELVGRHTMTVDMIARTMQKSELTVPEMYEELSKEGGYGSDAFVPIEGEKEGDFERRKIEGHLIRLFHLTNFDEREQALFRYAQLIGENSGMERKMFLDCCPHPSRKENTANLEALEHLIQLGYVRQEADGDSEEKILRLHTLVRAVAKKVLPLEQSHAEAFLEGMPPPYRRSDVEFSDKSKAALAEAYAEARKTAEKGTFLFGYWASCAAAWFLNMRDCDDMACLIVEYLLDAVCVYKALKNGALSLADIPNGQKKEICFYWNLWNGLGYATPGLVRQKCGISELAREYWTICLDEPERKLNCPALFHEYQKCGDFWEEIRQKLLTEFYPDNYWDYWAYRRIADTKEQIQAGKELLEHFERKTPEDYERYMEICRELTEDAKKLAFVRKQDSSKSKERALFERQEEITAYEYLVCLEAQKPVDYKKIMRLCKIFIGRFEEHLNGNAIIQCQKKLLETRKDYLDFLTKQPLFDVVEQMMCCDGIVFQYRCAFPDKEKCRQYQERSMQIEMDFAENPEEYLPIESPLNEIKTYIRTLEDVICMPGKEKMVRILGEKILKIGKDNEKCVEKEAKLNKIEIHNFRWMGLFIWGDGITFRELLWYTIQLLEQKRDSEEYDESTLNELRSLLEKQSDMEKEEPIPVFERKCDGIASETESLLHDLQNEEITNEKDRNYRKTIFAKINNAGWKAECEEDLERIVDAYEKAGDYGKQLKWLEQIILLQSAGIWSGCRYYFFGEEIFNSRTKNGKLDPDFYERHDFMGPYYERAINAAQKNYDNEKAAELADEMFHVFSKDREVIIQYRLPVRIPELMVWLRACSLYTYCCCVQGQYRNGMKALKLAEKDFMKYVMRRNPYLHGQEKVMMDFYNEQMTALKKVLPKHHPIFAIQYKLMYPCCEGLKETVKIVGLIMKESVLSHFYNWNSWWLPKN